MHLFMRSLVLPSQPGFFLALLFLTAFIAVMPRITQTAQCEQKRLDTRFEADSAIGNVFSYVTFNHVFV
jgi:hypothetical protein